MKRTAVELPDVTWTRDGASFLGATRYHSSTGCMALVGTPGTEGRWHVSVSHPERYPTWDELASIRDEATPPGVELHMVFPTADEYVNVHATTLHLWGP